MFAARFVVVAAVIVTFAFAAPVPAASTLSSRWSTSGNSYPTVFLHGLAGWGEAKPLLGLINYWGGPTENILTTLRAQGYTVAAPHMGPLSSNWERACEAFAQITGAVTDYGLARSTAFGHARFGENYTGTALVPGFMSTTSSKINLVGHSMGGPTQRMLTHLLTYGSQAEMNACTAAKVECSPLFWTNKTTSYVNAVFAISGVHQGSVVADLIQANGEFEDLFLEFILLLIGANEFDGIHLYDMQLGHWGLTQGANETFTAFLERILKSDWINKKSNALFDLSAASLTDPLLSFVMNSNATTYFSSAGLTTEYLLGFGVPEVTTFAFLIPFAGIIGGYSNSSLAVLSTYTQKDWRMNDGLVAIASSRGPQSGYNSFSVAMKSTSTSALIASAPNTAPSKGIYNYVGAIDNTDHISIVGLFDLVSGLRTNYFLNIMTVLSAVSA